MSTESVSSFLNLNLMCEIVRHYTISKGLSMTDAVLDPEVVSVLAMLGAGIGTRFCERQLAAIPTSGVWTPENVTMVRTAQAAAGGSYADAASLIYYVYAAAFGRDANNDGVRVLECRATPPRPNGSAFLLKDATLKLQGLSGPAENVLRAGVLALVAGVIQGMLAAVGVVASVRYPWVDESAAQTHGEWVVTME